MKPRRLGSESEKAFSWDLGNKNNKIMNCDMSCVDCRR